VAITTVRDVEAEKRAETTAAGQVVRALKNGGVEFVAGSDTDGPGVRLAGDRPNVIRRPQTMSAWDGLPLEVEFRGRRFTAFISTEILEDLAEIPGDARPTHPEYLQIFDRFRPPSSKAYASALSAPRPGAATIAGYEIQKAEQEYERVLQGKVLFDQDFVQLLAKAQNNNERYEILSGLKDYAIPNYDDLPAAYDRLRPALLATVQAARLTTPVPVDTPYGRMEGMKSDAIIRLVVDIIESTRYADVVGTLQILMDLYRDETDTRLRKTLVNAVKHLSEYNIDIYRQVGAGLQLALVDYLAKLNARDIDPVLNMAIAVCTECLQSDITAARWTADNAADAVSR
jgi:hypothetical protein